MIVEVSTPSLDVTLQLVADPHRRQVLQYLRDVPDGQTTLDHLVDQVTAGGPSTRSDRPNRDELALLLHHLHLPRLADHGVVAFDPDRGVVRYRADERIERVLDALAEN